MPSRFLSMKELPEEAFADVFADRRDLVRDALIHWTGRQNTPEEGNVLYSPLALVYSIIAQTGNLPEQEQTALLHSFPSQSYPLSELRVLEEAAARVERELADHAPGLTLKLLALGQKQLEWNPDFLKRAQELYNVQAITVDHSQTEALGAKLASYAETALGSPAAVKVPPLPTDEKLSLTSFAGFRTAWLPQSPSKTEKAVFHGKAGDKEVPMLTYDKVSVGYAKAPNYLILALLQGGGLELRVLIPEEGTSPREALAAYQSSVPVLTGTQAQLELPELDLAQAADFGPSLPAMGLEALQQSYGQRAFEIQDGADVQGRLESLLQVSRLTVGAKGVQPVEGKAAGAENPYAIKFTPPEPLKCKLDKPFALLICYEGAPIFVAEIRDLG